MALHSFLSQEFNISETSKKFLESYVSRVRNYIERHHLDPQLSEDLFDRLLEKLSTLSPEKLLLEKEIIAIVNSLWEPEDIFRDSISSSSENIQKNRITKADVKDFFKREFHRNSQKGVILGVCAGLGETFEINPIWIRLGFIVLLPFYGSALFVYIILGILLPDSARDGDAEKKIEKNIENVARDVETMAKNIETGVKNYTETSKEGIIVKFFRGIREMIRGIFGIFAKIVVFSVLAGITMAFLGTGIGILVASGFAAAHPVILNQDLFRSIPSWIPVLGLFCGLACVSLALILGAKSLGKNIGNGSFVMVCCIVLASGVFAVAQTGTQMVGNFWKTYSTGSVVSFDMASGSAITIDPQYLDTLRDNDWGFHFSVSESNIRIIPSEDQKISVRSKTTIRTSLPESAQEILSSIIPLRVELSGNTLSVRSEGDSSFSNVVPLTLVDRTLEITIPKNITIRALEKYPYRIEGIETSKKMRKYSLSSCNSIEASYSADNNTFICHDESAILRAIQEQKESMIREQNADFFSDDIDGWVRIKDIQYTDSGAVVTWKDDKKPLRRTLVRFSEASLSSGDDDVFYIVGKEEMSDAVTLPVSSGSHR